MDGPRPDAFGPGTYGDAFADVYGTWYATITDADATARFVDRVCGAGPILELGVGDGRIGRPLAALGRCVIGVDASAAMLDACTAADPERTILPVRADLARLPVHGPIAGALCAFNTLFNLASADEQQALFASVSAALGEGGAFVIEAITGAGLSESSGQSVGVSRLDVDRLVLNATVVDADAQTIHGQHVDISESGIRLRPWRLRWTTPAQLDAMAAAAGLVLNERHGGWLGEPYGDDADSHVSVYRRAD